MKKLFLVIIIATVFVGSCNNATDTNTSGALKDSRDSAMENHIAKEERNKKIIKESLEGFNSHNVDAFLKDASDDMIDYFDGGGKPAKGKDSIKKAYQGGFETFGDVKGEDLKYFAEGDLVMVWGIWTGKWVKDVEGQKATGKPYRINDVDVFKLSEAGKILEHYGTQSGIAVVLQVGFKPK